VRSSRPALHAWSGAVGAALIGLYLAGFVARNTALQWDLKIYLLAAHAARAGLDPYRLADLSAVAGRAAAFPFLYPPVSLLLFAALGTLPVATAAALWIGLKAVLLAGLVYAWKRWFVPGAALLPLALLAVFGWNAAALWDLRTGNVALVEAALLWTGFGCFVAGRRGAFALFVVAAACFKLMPATFLLLLLVPTGEHRPSPRRFFVALAALAALAWGPLFIGPASHWRGFLGHVPEAATLGDANPSSYALAATLAGAARLAPLATSRLAVALWAAYALALLALSLPFLRDTWRSRDARRWVMAALFLDLLLEPRPMAYGFLRLAPAPLFFSPAPFDRPAGRLLLALALSLQGLLRAASLQVETPLVMLSPFLLTLAIWLLVVRGGNRAS
jgi:hypothetical protein